MDSLNDKFIKVYKIIEKDNVNELQRYIEDNKIELKKFNNDKFDMLIWVIEIQSSVAMVEFIIHQCQYHNLQYTFYFDREFEGKYYSFFNEFVTYEGIKTPLFSAIAFNNYEVANLLIKHNADINYTIKNRNHQDINILLYLNHIYDLNSKNLKFILNHGFKLQGITPDLISDLISMRYEDNLLEMIFKHYLYTNNFVINLLYFYKNKAQVSNSQLKEYILKEKSKIQITDLMYEDAFEISLEKMDIIELLLDFDTREPEEVFNKLDIYELLENALFLGENNMINKILGNKNLKFSNKILEDNFIKVIKFNCYESLKFSLDVLENNPSFDVQCINFKRLLISATLDNPLFNKDKRIKENNKKIIFLLLKFILHIDKKREIISYEAVEDNEFHFDLTVFKTFDISYSSLILNAFIKLGHLSYIKILLENEQVKSYIDINVCDENGRYPIFNVFYSTYDKENYYKNLEIFKYLLVKGANADVKNEKGKTLWSSVMEGKNYKTIKCLLDNYTFPYEDNKLNLITNQNKNQNYDHNILMNNFNDNNGNNDNKDNSDNINNNNNNTLFMPNSIIEDKKSDFENLSFEFTPLILSYFLNRQEIFNYLIQYVDIDEKDKYGNNVLFYSIIKGDTSTVKFLIQHGADVNFKRCHNECIHSVVENELYERYYSGSDVKRRKYLFEVDTLNLGVKRYKYELKDSPLHLSIFNNCKDIFFILLDHKDIRVNEPNKLEEIPLMTLIKCQSFSIEDKLIMVKKLIEKNADVNFINSKNGKMPLAYAIQIQSLPIIKLLIENGAEADCRIGRYDYDVSQRQSLLKYAIIQNNIEIVKFLVECLTEGENSSLDNILVEEILEVFNKNKNYEIFDYLIKNKKINGNKLSSNSLLNIIAEDHFDLFKLFLNYGLDIKGSAKEIGRKALYNAISERKFSIAKYLIDNGADYLYVNNDLKRLTLGGNTELLDFLKENHFNFNKNMETNYNILNKILLDKMRQDLTFAIKNNNILEFKNITQEIKNKLEDTSLIKMDLLAVALQNNSSLEMVETILINDKYKTLNYFFLLDNRERLPLSYAIEKNNLKLADLLIEYGANVKAIPISILKNIINEKNSRYIIEKGYHVTPFLMNNIIQNKLNFFLKEIYRYYYFNNEFILNLLTYYKDRKPLALEKLESILNSETLIKVKVDKSLYELAFNTANYEAINILYENDINNKHKTFIYLFNVISLFDKDTIMVILDSIENKELKSKLSEFLTNKENIKSIIESGNVRELRRYKREKNISLNDLFKMYSERDDILKIALMSKNSNISMIDYLIKRCNYKNLKYFVSINKKIVPIIFFPLSQNRFDIFDFLIKNGADVNHGNVLLNLYRHNLLNKKNLYYLLNNNLKISIDVLNFIISKHDSKLLEYILKYYIYNDTFILNFLSIYKNKTPLSYPKLQSIITTEKNKLSLMIDSLYKMVLSNEDYKAMNILCRYDYRDKNTILCKLFQLIDKNAKKFIYINNIEKGILKLPVDEYFVNNLRLSEERILKSKEIIGKNNFYKLKNYVAMNNFLFPYLNNGSFDPLIYAIENDTSFEMIEFITSQDEMLIYGENSKSKALKYFVEKLLNVELFNFETFSFESLTMLICKIQITSYARNSFRLCFNHPSFDFKLVNFEKVLNILSKKNYVPMMKWIINESLKHKTFNFKRTNYENLLVSVNYLRNIDLLKYFIEESLKHETFDFKNIKFNKILFFNGNVDKKHTLVEFYIEELVKSPNFDIKYVNLEEILINICKNSNQKPMKFLKLINKYFINHKTFDFNNGISIESLFTTFSKIGINKNYVQYILGKILNHKTLNINQPVTIEKILLILCKINNKPFTEFVIDKIITNRSFKPEFFEFKSIAYDKILSNSKLYRNSHIMELIDTKLVNIKEK
eukprot:jgi/Orpsp1_1/1186084/evm.model.c7180000096798.1